ncbi:MAG: hypothetical protein ACLTDR_00840 [Adlercreutzia equolifaciens]
MAELIAASPRPFRGREVPDGSRKQAAAPSQGGHHHCEHGNARGSHEKGREEVLSQFLMDPRICPMPRPVWWTLLHTTILRSARAPRRRSTRRSG